MFISSETKRRHQFIDQYLGAAHSTLTNPQVARILGDTTATLLDIDRRMFVPNVRDGVVQIPRWWRRAGGIPVVAVSSSERLLMGDDFCELNPRQRAAAMNRVAQVRRGQPSVIIDDKQQKLKELVANNEDPRTRPLANVRANVASRTLQDPDELLIAWPLLVFNQDKDDVSGTDQGPIIVHEYAHVWQYEREPFVAPWDPNMALGRNRRDEVEAYSVGAAAVLGLRLSGMRCADPVGQVVIDGVRREVNEGQPDPYAFSPELQARWRAVGVTTPLLVG